MNRRHLGITATAVLVAVVWSSSIALCSGDLLRQQLRGKIVDRPRSVTMVQQTFTSSTTKLIEQLQATSASKESIANLQKSVDQVSESLKDPGLDLDTVSSAIGGAAVSVEKLTTAIQNDNAEDIMSAALSTVGSIALAIPGAEPVGMLLALFGAITGATAPTASQPSSITIDDIRHAVEVENDIEISKLEADDILTACNDAIANMQDSYTTFTGTLAVEKSHAVLKKSFASLVADMNGEYQQALSNTWVNIRTGYLDQDIVEKGAPCYDTCYLQVSPVDKWLANSSYPDLSELSGSGWDICPIKFYNLGNQLVYCKDMQNVPSNKKLCIWNSVKPPTTNSFIYGALEPSSFWQYTGSLDEGCSTRVDNIEACQQNVAKAANAHSRLRNLLACARTQTIAFLTVVTNLLRIGKALEFDLGVLQGGGQALNISLYRALHWNPVISEQFKGKDGYTYQCNQPATWIHLAGYDSNNVLRKAPCTTDQYCTFISQHGDGDGLNYCTDTLKCSNINPDNEHLDFTFAPPTYSYDLLFTDAPEETQG